MGLICICAAARNKTILNNISCSAVQQGLPWNIHLNKRLLDRSTAQATVQINPMPKETRQGRHKDLNSNILRPSDSEAFVCTKNLQLFVEEVLFAGLNICDIVDVNFPAFPSSLFLLGCHFCAVQKENKFCISMTLHLWLFDTILQEQMFWHISGRLERTIIWLFLPKVGLSPPSTLQCDIKRMGRL